MSLDLAHQRKPMVAVYWTGMVKVAGGSVLLTMPNRLLPNIVAGERIVPEFVPHSGGTGPVVRALEPKRPEVVVLGGVPAPVLGGVALRALGATSAAVRVHMTVAAVRRQAVLVVDVALVALHVDVLAEQRPLRLASVVERLDAIPPLGLVALVARPAELPDVKVLVAVGAGRVDGFVVAALVAPDALDLRVAPGELEAGAGVVELGANLEVVEALVARIAGRVPELRPVHVRVA